MKKGQKLDKESVLMRCPDCGTQYVIVGDAAALCGECELTGDGHEIELVECVRELRRIPSEDGLDVRTRRR